MARYCSENQIAKLDVPALNLCDPSDTHPVQELLQSEVEAVGENLRADSIFRMLRISPRFVWDYTGKLPVLSGLLPMLRISPMTDPSLALLTLVLEMYSIGFSLTRTSKKS
jgi:hypothetical protein